MDFSCDLLRVIWHELGHLAIDIIKADNSTEYKIQEVKFCYFKDAISNEKWGGAVKMIPPIKFNLLIEKSDELSFAYICLLSGCVFQTTFYQSIQKEDVQFEQCFSLARGSAGNGDLKCFNEIDVLYRKKYGNRANHTNYIHRDLYQKIYNIIYKKRFLKYLNALALKYRDKILILYNELSENGNFDFSFSEEDLQELISELRTILHKNSIYESIYNLQEVLANCIDQDKQHGMSF